MRPETTPPDAGPIPFDRTIELGVGGSSCVGVRPAAPRSSCGRRPGQQLVEQGPEGVDIGGGGHGLSEQLLRRGVLGRHELLAGAGQHPGVGHIGEQLGDPEVEQLHLAVAVDEDVARFEIAVDHEIAVEIADRVDDLEKEPQDLVDAHTILGAVLRDGSALDQLHDEVGSALVGDSAIQQAGDVRVREPGEELPLGEETRSQLGGVHVAVEKFERDLLVEGAVDPLGAVDRAHPAPADGGDGLVGPDPDLGAGGALDLQRRRPRDLARQPVEELGGIVVEGEELIEFAVAVSGSSAQASSR